MVRWSMLLMLVAVFAAHGVAQDRLPPPLGGSPQIMVARAVEKDGGVVVTFSSPQFKYKTEMVEVEKEGKKVAMPRTAVEFVQWNDIDVQVDGKAVRAFGVDGKAIEPNALPKRLGKAAQVAVVLHHPADEPKLDPYYLSVLRKDLVVFTGPATKFVPPPPKK